MPSTPSPAWPQRGMTLDTWPVGTGPVHDDRVRSRTGAIVMKRNPNYRGEPYPCEGMPGDKEAGLLDDCGKTMPFIDTHRLDRRARSGRRSAASSARASTTSRSSSAPTPAWTTWSRCRTREEVRDRIPGQGLQAARSYSDVNSYIIGFNMLDPVHRQRRHARAGRAQPQAAPGDLDRHRLGRVLQDLPEEGRRDRDEPAAAGHLRFARGHARRHQPGDAHVWSTARPCGAPIDDAKKLMVEAGYPNGRDAKTGRPLVHQLRLLRAGHARAQARDRLGGAPVRQDRHPARGARHRQQPVPGQGAQGQAPGVLAGLELPTTPTPRTSCSCSTARTARPSPTARTPRTTQNPEYDKLFAQLKRWTTARRSRP